MDDLNLIDGVSYCRYCRILVISGEEYHAECLILTNEFQNEEKIEILLATPIGRQFMMTLVAFQIEGIKLPKEQQKEIDNFLAYCRDRNLYSLDNGAVKFNFFNLKYLEQSKILGEV